MGKDQIVAYFDSIADKRDQWRAKNRYYHSEVRHLLKFLIPEGLRVLDVGSSTGELLDKLKPSRGIGIDLSPRMIELAREKHPHLQFLLQDAEGICIDERFDYVVLSGCIGVLQDVWKVFRCLRKVTTFESRVVITYYNGIWELVLKLAQKLGCMLPRRHQNWLGLSDIDNLLYLNGFEVIKQGKKILLPVSVPILSWFFNRVLANIPVIWRLCLVEYVVAKKVPLQESSLQCSVVVPCRNEVGNIEALLKNLPAIGVNPEIIFVDGNSTDGTVEKILELMPSYKNKFDIKLIHQIPREEGMLNKPAQKKSNKMLKLGKGDAVRKGFDKASHEVLIILDSDCTVPPAEMPKFFLSLAESRGEFINGSRLVYPMEKQAMRMLNLYANELFGLIFSWLLDQKIKDTLCGTKALTKQAYLKIKENRSYFGDFDPFGDFDLLFGAAKQNLKIVELPVRYRARTSGDIKIERFKHGLLLVQMCFIAFRRFKMLLMSKNYTEVSKG
ncbi:MAG: glycosyltransferase [Patescibacteria group bacterium]